MDFAFSRSPMLGYGGLSSLHELPALPEKCPGGYVLHRVVRLLKVTNIFLTSLHAKA